MRHELPDLEQEKNRDMPKFTAGRSGNPDGRPPGVPDRRTRFRELFENAAERLIKKLISRAADGDMQAMKLCIERIIPPLRSEDEGDIDRAPKRHVLTPLDEAAVDDFVLKLIELDRRMKAEREVGQE